MATAGHIGAFVEVVQHLSQARSLEVVMDIVRTAARELTGADGATFVLREGDLCHYAEEDAVSPLWKGRRFELDTCISGWVMLNRQAAVIPDVYSDPRVPAAAYQPTFVKSLVMVPIRTQAPIGAIGNYWATLREPDAMEVQLLQALADTTSVALENVRVYQELEQRVEARTAELSRMVEELQQAMREVHTLRGLIPICVYCRNVRDDSGYWQHLDNYLVEHMGARVSHGICPQCYSRETVQLVEPDPP